MNVSPQTPWAYSHAISNDDPCSYGYRYRMHSGRRVEVQWYDDALREWTPIDAVVMNEEQHHA